MGRAARRQREPAVRPVEKVELSGRHRKLRLAAALLCLVIGAAALSYAFTTFVTDAAGWQEVEANASESGSCAGEFVFLYNAGASGTSARRELRELKALYTDAAASAYRLFSCDAAFEGVHNLWYLNLHTNEEVEVNPALYAAFESIASADSRTIYLGPIYEQYNGLFSCESDEQTVDFDPYQNEDLRAFYAKAAAYASDPAAISLELLGDNRMRLSVSEEVLAFAAEEGVTRFLDFGWLKNAFVADFLADTLISAGYTYGTLSSYDGFMRTLGGGEEVYSLNVYDAAAGPVRRAAVLDYTGARSIVCLRNHAMQEMDAWRIYAMPDGTSRTTYLDTADGLPKAACTDLTLYSTAVSCADIALAVADVYIADALNTSALESLAKEDIFALWCEEQTLTCTDPDAALRDLDGYSIK